MHRFPYANILDSKHVGRYNLCLTDRDNTYRQEYKDSQKKLNNNWKNKEKTVIQMKKIL